MNIQTQAAPLPTLPASGRWIVATFSLTLITSAGLLFWLQPMIAKFILPFVGGAPAVWNTAMLFFQAALLGGYIYAHLLNRHLGRRGQTLVHLSLLTLCLLWLPIGVDTTVLPPAEGNPSWWLLSVLAMGIGVPFIVVSGSAPLLQCWFAASGHKDADNPYFLYAASNIGSMAALFGFPLVAEPLLDLPSQSFAWSSLFTLLLALTALTAWMARKGPELTFAATVTTGPAPTATQRFLWLALVMVSTSLMLGVTTHLTTDVAAVPLLWVVPLSLYLLTFIIVFARKPIIGTEGTTRLLLMAFVAYGLMWYMGDISISWLIRIGVLLSVFFIVVLACHTQLAQIKPPKAWLTEFYLWIAVGGVAGGAFNALLAPILFESVIEFRLMLLVSITLILAARVLYRGESPRIMLILTVVCALMLPIAERIGLLLPEGSLMRERNFYGVLTVRNDLANNLRKMSYGTTIHGMRDLTPGREMEPTGYYGVHSPVYEALTEIASRPVKGDIGAIGLGVGAISCHPTGGRTMTFYEINPAVTRIAENTAYFSFLKGCNQPYEVIHGDGRLKISEAATGQYDMLFLDAFSSDSIPVHLLTREAFEVYFDKLSTDGIMVIHITNRHMNLAPVIASIVSDLNLAVIHRQALSGSHNDVSNELNPETHMVAVARKPADFGTLTTLPGWHPLPSTGDARTWTDSYTNIVGTLRIFQD